MYEEYQKYPLITKKRLFYETMEDVLPDLDVIVTDGNTQSILPLGSLYSGISTTEGGN
jgi:membrane protease subunit HflK